MMGAVEAQEFRHVIRIGGPVLSESGDEYLGIAGVLAGVAVAARSQDDVVASGEAGVDRSEPGEASASSDALSVDDFAGRQLDAIRVVGSVLDAEVVAGDASELRIAPGALERGLCDGDAGRKSAVRRAGESGRGGEVDENLFSHRKCRQEDTEDAEDNPEPS